MPPQRLRIPCPDLGSGLGLQVMSSFIATLGAFLYGCGLGWSGAAGRNLDPDACGDECDISGVGSSLYSWVAPAMPLGGVFVGHLTGYMLSKMNRNRVMMTMCIPAFLGATLVCLSKPLESLYLIVAGRLLFGFGTSALVMAAGIYICEIAEDSNRGALGSMVGLQIVVGVTLVSATSINEAIHWHITSIAFLVILVLTIVALCFLPESPHFLLAIGNEEKARKMATRLWRRCEADLDTALANLKSTLNEVQAFGPVSYSALMTKGVYLKPLLLTVLLMIVQQFSGILYLVFYSQKFFEMAGVGLDPGASAFIIHIAQILGVLTSVSVVDRWGRRPLLIVSNTIMSLSVGIIALLLYLKLDHPVNDALPVVCLVAFMFFFNIGIGPLAWSMNAELLPVEIRAMGVPFAFTINALAAFSVSKFSHDLERALGIEATFLMLSVNSAVGAIVMFFLIPEIKGKSNVEIREMFESNHIPSAPRFATTEL